VTRAAVAALIGAVFVAGWSATSAQEGARERWAVVIGANHPGGPRMLPRKHADADAEAFYDLITTTGGFKKENVLLLTDHSERKPTLRNIKYALGTFLTRSAERDALVIMYFAGQGAAEAGGAGLAAYFLPSDADRDDLYSTAILLNDLQFIFQGIQAERMVAFLHCSYSGAAAGPGLASKKAPGRGDEGSFLERLGGSRGRAIVASSKPSEVVLEAPDLGHGIFTYYVVEGLKGAADLNGDGIVSLQELYEYVEREASRKSRAIGGNQHPMMKGELDLPLPHIRVPRH